MRTLNHPSIIKMLAFIETKDVSNTEKKIRKESNLMPFFFILFI
jgi:hypothetical protein